MPFTPFHVGPALLIYAVFPKLDPIAIFYGSILVDIEFFLITLLDLPFSIHGPLHSIIGVFLLLPVFLGATLITRKALPKIDSLFIEPKPVYTIGISILSCLIGGFSHLLLDAPLYSDFNFTWPILDINPLFRATNSINVYIFCILTFVIGLIVLVLRKRKAKTR